MLRKRRVRVHLAEREGEAVPSVEGLLLSRWGGEIVIGVPSLIVDPTANPLQLPSRRLVIPRERVLFWEVL